MANEWGDQPAAAASVPQGANEWGDKPAAGGGGAEQSSAASRLWSSFVAALPHPIDAIKEWAERPAEIRKAMDGLHELNQLDAQAAADPQNQGKPRNQWVMPKATPDQRQTIEAAMNARLTTPEGNLAGEIAGPAVTAGKQAASGDIAGAGGTVLGGYVAPAAAATVAPAIVKAAPAAAKAVARGATAAAPDVAAGTAKVAGGATLGYVAGKLGLGQLAEYLSAKDAVAAGLRQIVSGVKSGWQAGKATLSPEPAPTAATAPAAAPQPPPEAPAAVPAIQTPAPAAAAAPEPPAHLDLPNAKYPTEAAPQITRIPSAHEGEAAPDFAATARASKVRTLADTLDGEIAHEDAARMTPGDWNRLADALGINRPSPKTIAATLDELKTRDAARAQATMMTPSPAMLEALRRPGALDAAKALQEEMNRSAATDINRDSANTVAQARSITNRGQTEPKQIEPGHTVTTKKGKTVTVTKVNPNGTFEYAQ